MARDDDSVSPLALIMRRFWKARSARILTGILAALALLGIYAPFLTNDLAFIWWDETGLSFPLFSDLFNYWSYKDRHDLLFNLIALLSPPLLLGAWLLRRRLSPRWRWGGSISLIVLAWLFCQVPLIPGPDDLRPVWRKYEEPNRSWVALSHRRALLAEGPGAAVNGDRLLLASGAVVQVLYRNEDGQSFTVVDPAGAETVVLITELRVPEQYLALFAPVPHGFDQQFAGAVLQYPGAVNATTGSRFWLGTEASGRDLLAVMLFGARISLTVGFLATGIAFTIGIIVGAISGYFGGWVDLVLQRIVEIVMNVPAFILALVVTAVFSRNIFVVITVFGLVGWAGVARLVRGEFLSQGGREYVLACQALGLPHWRIMFRHILPNAVTPLLVSASFGVAGAILGEAGLAFLGLIESSTPSWGLILNVGRDKTLYPHLIWAPGMAIFILVYVLNAIGNHLREAFDPKGRS